MQKLLSAISDALKPRVTISEEQSTKIFPETGSQDSDGQTQLFSLQLDLPLREARDHFDAIYFDYICARNPGMWPGWQKRSAWSARIFTVNSSNWALSSPKMAARTNPVVDHAVRCWCGGCPNRGLRHNPRPKEFRSLWKLVLRDENRGNRVAWRCPNGSKTNESAMFARRTALQRLTSYNQSKLGCSGDNRIWLRHVILPHPSSTTLPARSACWQWMPCKRQIPAIRARRWAWRNRRRVVEPPFAPQSYQPQVA